MHGHETEKLKREPTRTHSPTVSRLPVGVAESLARLGVERHSDPGS